MNNALFQHAGSLPTKPMWLDKEQVFRLGRQQEDPFTETKGLMGWQLLAQLGGSCRTVKVLPLPWPLYDRRLNPAHLEITITAPCIRKLRSF